MEMVPLNQLNLIKPMEKMVSMNASQEQMAINTEEASFLDIFRGLVENVVETNEQVDRDAIDLMLGNIDDIAQVEANISKASVAVDLLVTVKNEALSAYNTIINMQV